MGRERYPLCSRLKTQKARCESTFLFGYALVVFKWQRFWDPFERRVKPQGHINDLLEDWLSPKGMVARSESWHVLAISCHVRVCAPSFWARPLWWCMKQTGHTVPWCRRPREQFWLLTILFGSMFSFCNFGHKIVSRTSPAHFDDPTSHSGRLVYLQVMKLECGSRESSSILLQDLDCWMASIVLPVAISKETIAVSEETRPNWQNTVLSCHTVAFLS